MTHEKQHVISEVGGPEHDHTLPEAETLPLWDNALDVPMADVPDDRGP